MKAIVILLLFIDSLQVASWFILKDQISTLHIRISAQDDVISRIATEQFDNRKEIAVFKDLEGQTNKDLADRITKVANSLAYQQKLIDRVRAYAYNEATRNEPVDL